jgi:hypothetical protein
VILYFQYANIPHKVMVDWDAPDDLHASRFLRGVLGAKNAMDHFSMQYVRKVGDQRILAGDDFWDWLPEQ